MKQKYRTALIVSVITVLLIMVWYFDLLSYLSPEALQKYRDTLKSSVDNSYTLSVIIFILIYTVATGLSLPGATVLTLTGGLLFGYTGVVFVNIGATAGAGCAFLAARYIIGESLESKYGDRLEKFNSELEKNGANYLLTVRLIPVFPFFLINLLAGLTRIPLKTFIWTTAAGIIPGSLFYIYAGMQLNNIEKIDPLSAEFYLIVTILGTLAMLPVIIKKIKEKRAG